MTNYERVKDRITNSGMSYIERHAALNLLRVFGAQMMYNFLMELASHCKDALITCHRDEDGTEMTMIKCDHLKGC